MDQENNNAHEVCGELTPAPVQEYQVQIPPPTHTFRPIVIPRPDSQTPVPTEEGHRREVWMAYNQGYNEGFTKGYNTAMSKAGHKKSVPISQKYAKSPKQRNYKPTYNHFGKLRTKQQNYQTASKQQVVLSDQCVNTPPGFQQHEGIYRYPDPSNVWNNTQNTKEWK